MITMKSPFLPACIICFIITATTSSDGKVFEKKQHSSLRRQHPSSIEYRILLQDNTLYLNPAARSFLTRHADRLDDVVRDLEDKESSTNIVEAVKRVTRVDVAPKNNPYPVAYLFGGGAGAGKTALVNILEEDVAILNQIFNQENNFTDNDYVLINGDDIMGVLPCYANDDSPCRASNSTWEGGEIGDALLKEAAANKQHILVDGTLKTVSSATRRLDILHQNNYTLVVHLGVTRPTAVAARDAFDRAIRTNRWVPISALVNTHVSYSKSFPTYAKPDFRFDDVRLVRNLWPESTDHLTLWANYSVSDQKEYAAFLAKANDTVDSVLKEIDNATIKEGYRKLEENCEFNRGACCFNWSNLDESQEPYLSQIDCDDNDGSIIVSNKKEEEIEESSSSPSSGAAIIPVSYNAIVHGIAMACILVY